MKFFFSAMTIAVIMVTTDITEDIAKDAAEKLFLRDDIPAAGSRRLASGCFLSSGHS